MASGDTKTEALLNILGNGGDATAYQGCCNTKTQQYILDAIDRVQNVEDEVEEIKNNPDVVDIVDTYADLQAYDTQHLTDNDIIRVLSDSTHSGNSTYYRWNATTSQFDFVGEIAGGGGGAEFIELTTADYNWNSSTGATGTPNCVALWLLPSGIYKGPADSSIEVRATRSQGYSMGAGFPSYAIVKECENTSSNRAIVTYVDGGNGSVVEYYSIAEDGRNYSIKNFPNVVQTTGTSTTDVMSQKATTSMVYQDPSTAERVQIGGTSSAYRTVAIGKSSRASSARGVAIGEGAQANGLNTVAIGGGSSASVQGEMNIGTPLLTGTGYNNTDYRLLTGLYDPVNAHDAATKGYVDSHSGGVTPVQTTGTSTTDVMSQKAVTDTLFNSSGSSGDNIQQRIKIGKNTVASGAESAAVGSRASASGDGGVALGAASQATAQASVALAFGQATQQGEFNVGTGYDWSSGGYNNTAYRLITGVHDGQSAHDAVTVGQVNSVIDAINTALSTNIPHIGA